MSQRAAKASQARAHYGNAEILVELCTLLQEIEFFTLLSTYSELHSD